jgi:hypothetical protein
MGYLLEKFQEHKKANDPHSGVSTGYDEGDPNMYLDEFITFCRAEMKRNQPVSMDYIEKGFAIRLQDGTVVPFVDDPVEQTGGIEGGIELTKPDERKDKGIDSANSYAFGITGGDLKKAP